MLRGADASRARRARIAARGRRADSIAANAVSASAGAGARDDRDESAAAPPRRNSANARSWEDTRRRFAARERRVASSAPAAVLAKGGPSSAAEARWCSCGARRSAARRRAARGRRARSSAPAAVIARGGAGADAGRTARRRGSWEARRRRAAWGRRERSMSCAGESAKASKDASGAAGGGQAGLEVFLSALGDARVAAIGFRRRRRRGDVRVSTSAARFGAFPTRISGSLERAAGRIAVSNARGSAARVSRRRLEDVAARGDRRGGRRRTNGARTRPRRRGRRCWNIRENGGIRTSDGYVARGDAEAESGGGATARLLRAETKVGFVDCDAMRIRQYRSRGSGGARRGARARDPGAA